MTGTESPAPAASTEARLGVIYGATAFSIWGLSAMFYKLLAEVPALEIVAHRVVWSLPVAAVVLIIMGRTRDIAPALRNPRLLATLALTAMLVSVNWGLYVWAIAADRALEASLGYFITPLVNVAIGFALLGERLKPAQALAVAFAVAAVTIQTVLAGIFPWLALTVAFSFGFYGYVRKTIAIGPAQGFLIEAVLLSVVAVPVILWLETAGEGNFLASPGDTLLLIATGLMTAGPLMLFSAAARRVRLATLGLMQYIAPSVIFLTAVFVFGEEVGGWRWVSFALIWSGLVVFTASSLREEKAQPAVATAKP